MRTYFLTISILFLIKPLAALHVEPKKKPNPGIVNQNGDDCFLNSSIQILTNLPLLDNLFSANNYLEDSIPGQIVHFQNELRTFPPNLGSALGYTYHDKKKGKNIRTYGSADLRRYIVTHSEKQQIKNMANGQQDAQEFLSELFALLSEDSKAFFENKKAIANILQHQCSDDFLKAFQLKIETLGQKEIDVEFTKKSFLEIVENKEKMYKKLSEVKSQIDITQEIKNLNIQDKRKIFAIIGIDEKENLNGMSASEYSLKELESEFILQGKLITKEDAVALSKKINGADWSNFIKNLEAINETSRQVKDVFESILQSSLTCKVCNKISTTDDPSWLLSLMINKSKGNSSVEELLQNFLSSSEIITGDEAVWCETCENFTSRLRNFSIKKLPQVLVISPKRFKNVAQRDDTLISCGEELTLNNESGMYIFQLIGVVLQSGSLNKGHYTAYVKDALDKKWYHYDDGHRSDINIASAIAPSKAGYIFLYARRNLVEQSILPIPKTPPPTLLPTPMPTPKPEPTPTDPLTKKLVALKTSLQELQKKLIGLKGTLETLKMGLQPKSKK